MKNVILLVLVLSSFIGSSQYTITGTFEPADDYQWVLAYRLKPGSQIYVAEARVTDAKFSLAIPENALPGTYRIVYAIPQEEYYFDVIYSGKEDVVLTFNEDAGVAFSASKENILFHAYFNEIAEANQQLIQLYTTDSVDQKVFKTVTKKLKETQKSYAEKSKGLLCHDFITANKPYIPGSFQPIKDYVDHRKKNYFTHLDFKNIQLQSSVFLTEKVVNYVMTALPLDALTVAETEKVMQQNVDKVSYYTEGVDDKYRSHLFYSLWGQTSASGYNATSDYIYTKYLKGLATAINNTDIITTIEDHNRIRIGTVPPPIRWKEGKTTRTLTSMEGAEHYVLVFWSSTCGHCLKELPQLQTGLQDNTAVQTLAVGLENGPENWEIESKKLKDFTHVIAEGKWDSEYAKAYTIKQTPTYFVLDKDKKIVAKPEDYKGVVSFLESQKKL